MIIASQIHKFRHKHTYIHSLYMMFFINLVLDRCRVIDSLDIYDINASPICGIYI